ncbi:MAG: hypothetical protein D6732_19495 [Methanobacteriota archaeon]|nr:MAG: hypothetical protein D6732_19495 [Euryarchaeota archaeon]
MAILDQLLELVGQKLFYYLPVIILPFIVILVWMVFFYNGSPFLTQMLIQLGYLFLAVPLIVAIFLSIPILAFGLFIGTTAYAEAFTTTILVLFIVFTFLIQYFYVKRIIRDLEEKEQMPILQIIKRDLFDKEYREQMRQRKKKRVEETRDYFDTITILNKEKKEKEKLERDRLRKVLMGEYDKQNAETERTE